MNFDIEAFSKAMTVHILTASDMIIITTMIVLLAFALSFKIK